MPDSTRPASPRITGVRDRRYTIRYPFAAVAELTDMQTGQKVDGVTSDISLGGCFICTNKALPMNCRARLKLTRKDQLFEALVVIRIVKPRVGRALNSSISTLPRTKSSLAGLTLSGALANQPLSRNSAFASPCSRSTCSRYAGPAC